MIGNDNIGKTGLFRRFTDNIFNVSQNATIGVDFKVQTLDIDGIKIKLQIWDTSGQERFKNIISPYYHGVQGIMLIYDITNLESFNNLNSWLIEIEKYAPKKSL